MSYNGSDQRPPLPPRPYSGDASRGQQHYYGTAGYQYPPPPGPPPSQSHGYLSPGPPHGGPSRSPGPSSNAHDLPPPLPPRIPSFDGRSASAAPAPSVTPMYSAPPQATQRQSGVYYVSPSLPPKEALRTEPTSAPVSSPAFPPQLPQLPPRLPTHKAASPAPGSTQPSPAAQTLSTQTGDSLPASRSSPHVRSETPLPPPIHIQSDEQKPKQPQSTSTYLPPSVEEVLEDMLCPNDGKPEEPKQPDATDKQSSDPKPARPASTVNFPPSSFGQASQHSGVPFDGSMHTADDLDSSFQNLSVDPSQLNSTEQPSRSRPYSYTPTSGEQAASRSTPYSYTPSPAKPEPSTSAHDPSSPAGQEPSRSTPYSYTPSSSEQEPSRSTPYSYSSGSTEQPSRSTPYSYAPSSAGQEDATSTPHSSTTEQPSRSTPYSYTPSPAGQEPSTSPSQDQTFAEQPSRSRPYSYSTSSTEQPSRSTPYSYSSSTSQQEPSRSTSYSSSSAKQGPPKSTPYSSTPNFPPSAQQPAASQTAAKQPSAGTTTSHATQSSALTPPFAVTTCVNIYDTVPLTWYWHPEVDDFWICSKCYVDIIFKSPFRESFRSEYFKDEKPRRCRFSTCRMKETMFPEAVSFGSLSKVVEWMRFRMTMADCQGTKGIAGGQGVRWYRPRNNEIPGFVACQACWEGCILNHPLHSMFELVPEGLHDPKADWSCDMAVSYIHRAYHEFGKVNNWAKFASEAKARLNMKPCPGPGETGITFRNSWFVPKNGPDGLTICAACWADKVVLTSDEDKWQESAKLKQKMNHFVECKMTQFNIGMPMSMAHEKDDFSIFWRAIGKLLQSPACANDGIKDGEWWTLPSGPREFAICKACLVGVIEPTDLSHLFKRKTNVPAGDTWLCAYNRKHPRFGSFVAKLVESYFIRDVTYFDQYASTWASIVPCKGARDFTGRFWYGWMDCTICRECYHTFASKFPNMVEQMQLQNQQLANSFMCEMYSSRMRKLYAKCAESNPPDLKSLLEFSAHRRQVYVQTVPQMRQMVGQAKMNLYKQQMLNTQSSHHLNLGLMYQTTFGSDGYTYGAPGVGYGFANHDLLQAEQYKQQAMGVMNNQTSATLQVGFLEEKWNAVE